MVSIIRRGQSNLLDLAILHTFCLKTCQLLGKRRAQSRFIEVDKGDIHVEYKYLKCDNLAGMVTRREFPSHAFGMQSTSFPRCTLPHCTPLPLGYPYLQPD